jgi:hypothetical protein
LFSASKNIQGFLLQMDPQHPPNPPDDWSDHAAAKDADTPIITSMKVQPEPEVQAYGNDNLTWQG